MLKNTPNPTGYRKEIDGLRAIAVLSVVIFHIYHKLLPGGFLGVDVFFVISGFLITSTIYKEIDRGDFSFSNFYVRRIKRILPAFYVVCAAVIAAGYLFFIPGDLVALLESVKACFLFVANFFFASRYDYFASNINEIPLLHAWSLAVEEQFYFIWPVVLIFLSRFKIKSKASTIFLVALTLASFVFAEFCVRMEVWEKAAYYLLPTRAGELLVGALLAIYWDAILAKVDIYSEKLATLGVVALLICFAAIDESLPFPGFNALWPCLATACILIGARKPGTWVYKWLTSSPMVYVGLISYSLYLWHWPVLAVGRYLFFSEPISVLQAVSSVLLMWLLAHLSWKYIETPTRHVKWNFKKVSVLFWLAPTAVALSIWFIVSDTDGLPNRYGEHASEIEQDTTFLSPGYCHENSEGDCLIGTGDAPAKTILWGDSNAGHYMPFWDKLAEKLGLVIFAQSADLCTPVLDVYGFTPSTEKHFSPHCEDLIKDVTQTITDYQVVIMAGAWSERLKLLKPERDRFLKQFEATLKYLSGNGKKVIVMEQIPIYSHQAYYQFLRIGYDFGEASALGESFKSKLLHSKKAKLQRYNAEIEKISKKYKNVYFYRPISKSPQLSAEMPFYQGHLMYKDGTHLNEFGSEHLGEISYGSLPKEIKAFFKN
ncbi:acyltransferase family protein [Bdellovibrio sp. HCB209]|uniref:acyltransferase family protein n=1 Tax=Bdellovibrio sp. HCB209 TaxID=3394354 RepID=UPI0039B68740